MVDHAGGFGAGCTERALVVDHAGGFGAGCTERALVVDHAAGFDALSAPLLAHVGEFDCV
ncbi:MAG: hypothetical protein ACOX69_10250 [Coriobacteriales bacterium]